MSQTADRPNVRFNRRRWFQFSLRGFLIVVTVGCLWLGWEAERARRRGKAIDEIAVMGGTVYYRDGFVIDVADYTTHFWQDLERTSITVELDSDIRLNATLGQLLADAVPIAKLNIYDAVADDDLQHLTYLNSGCSLTLYDANNVSATGLRDLERRLPQVEMGWLKTGDL